MAEPAAIGVGLIGSGVVGGGVAEVLLTRRDLIRQRGEVDLDLLLVADKERERALATGIAPDRITDDYRSVVSDPRISIVVELIGGVNLAYDVVSAALRAGKHVVTANKALLAERGGDLFALARTNNLCLSFEASVAGGIPLLLSLREGLIANRLSSLLGIVNGTCNYILSEMTAKGISFADSLKEAQNLGFAEADPSTDIDGKDSGHKLALLSALAFDTWIDFPSLHIEGIRNIQDSDIKITSFLGYTLKLLAVARTDPPPPPISQEISQELPGPGRLFLSVHPSLLRKSNPMASVSGSLNAVETNGDVVMESMFYGRGAGRYPTASAVVSDIAAIAKNLRYGGARGWFPPASNSYQIAPMEDYRTRYYLRFNVHDRSGVLGILATILGRHHVSIAAMHQFEDDPNDNLASVCLSTHLAREGDITQAIAEITRMDFLAGEPALIRIED